MTETPAAYTVDDQGDETTPRLGYTADEVEEVAPGEYAPLAIEDCEMTPRRARAAAVGMAPTEAEMAAAIRRMAEAEFGGDGEEFYAALNAIKRLAARLPGGRGIDG